MKLSVYQDGGFRLLTEGRVGTKKLKAAAVNIKKGDAVGDDGNGYATNADADMSVTFHGVAVEPVDNSGGAAGDLDVLVMPPVPGQRYSVPVDGNAVIAQTNVGVPIDLGADARHVAINDTVTGNWGFMVEDIDISAEALAAHPYGYAIGRFQMMSTT